MITLTTTYPPSANRLWRNVAGKVLKSAVYRAWLAENLHLGYQHKRTVSGPYALSLIVTAPDKRARDLDNIVKPVSDLLQACGIVSNDTNMKRLVAEWGDAPTACVVAEITPYVRGAA